MIAVIHFHSGNINSIVNMLKKAGHDPVIADNPAAIEQADHLILPGVGSFDNGMRQLQESGLLPVLEQKIRADKTPVLGICLGMQLFADRSEEGDHPGLGWISGTVKRFLPEMDGRKVRIPHIGWNRVEECFPSPLFSGMDDERRFYFVHSYHLVPENPEVILASTVYAEKFVAAIRKDNIWGVQFHPEKSHKYGLQLLKNFLESA